MRADGASEHVKRCLGYWGVAKAEAGKVDHLYIVGVPVLGVVKIGRSRDVRRRWVEIAGAWPVLFELEPALLLRGCGDLEGWVHEMLYEYRQHGEWFRDSRILRDAVSAGHAAQCGFGAVGVRPRGAFIGSIKESCRRRWMADGSPKREASGHTPDHFYRGQECAIG